MQFPFLVLTFLIVARIGSIAYGVETGPSPTPNAQCAPEMYDSTNTWKYTLVDQKFANDLKDHEFTTLTAYRENWNLLPVLGVGFPWGLDRPIPFVWKDEFNRSIQVSDGAGITHLFENEEVYCEWAGKNYKQFGYDLSKAVRDITDTRIEDGMKASENQLVKELSHLSYVIPKRQYQKIGYVTAKPSKYYENTSDNYSHNVYYNDYCKFIHGIRVTYSVTACGYNATPICR